MSTAKNRARLSDVCAIQMGYTLRGRLDSAATHGTPVIQLGDMSGDTAIRSDQLARHDLGDIPPRHKVRSGDVLFRPRGERNTATALGDDFGEPAVALSPIVILRTNRDVIEPSFLAWMINQPPAQRQFDLAAQGGRLRMIPKPRLESLEIEIPNMEIQRTIIAIDDLAEREQVLTTRAAELRRQLISRVLLDRARDTRHQTERAGTIKRKAQ